MKYTFGHYGIICDTRYRFEKDFTQTECDYDMLGGGAESLKGYYIDFSALITAGNITYNKAVLTDGEAKEILIEYMENEINSRMAELSSCLNYLGKV